MAEEQRKSALSEFMESVAYISLGMILAVSAYGILGAVLGTSNPVVTVVSDSMEPTLHRGDLLILKGIGTSIPEGRFITGFSILLGTSEGKGFGELSQGRANGSIIVYNYPPQNKLIVHRVWKIESNDTLKAWGDNNQVPDPWDVKSDWVRGKVILRVPYLGYPRLLMRDIAGF